MLGLNQLICSLPDHVLILILSFHLRKSRFLSTVFLQDFKRKQVDEFMPSYSNIYPARCKVTQFILSGNCSTCFGWYLYPSSGAQTTVSTASGICHTVTATCRYRGRVGAALLCNVASCWIYIRIFLLCTDP